MLGFVGAPFTLATYIVEGGSSKNFAHIKKMAFSTPEVLHALLDKLADNVADYVRYQVGAGKWEGRWHSAIRLTPPSHRTRIRVAVDRRS